MAITSSQRELFRSLVWLVCLAPAAWVAAQSAPTYRDATASVDARVADLLARMTIEEKAAQIQGIWNRKRETGIRGAPDCKVVGRSAVLRTVRASSL